MLKKINNCLIYFIIIVCSFLISLEIYILDQFKLATFEQLLYSIQNTEGTSFSALKDGLIFIIIHIIIFTIIFLLLKIFNDTRKKKNVIKISVKRFSFRIKVFPLNMKVPFALLILIYAIYSFGNGIGLFDYINSQNEVSNLYENYYVDSNKVKLIFPKNKQNLIYIFLESVETTALSIGNGGTVKNSYLPNLENTAYNNLNFSNNNLLGGALQIENTGWTIGGMVAQTSGIPLNVTGIDGNTYSDYNGGFLRGVTSIGDILLKNGYKNYLMLGSDATYGGRKDYFKEHGDYKIYDYNIAKKEKFINQDYSVWWGYEDSKLFEYAKQKLLAISSLDEPFNFTMLTADTHFVDGYLDESCSDNIFDSKYANVFYCSDSMVYSFIKWIQEQDFYDNTTIVISGDHLTMQSNFYKEIDNYDRTTYNAFINSVINTTNNKNRRFATIDMFPTTLASLGVKIEGDRLGLGTNLFSNKETLVESLGYDYLNKEIVKKSNYYNNYILGEAYFEMLENSK